MSVSPPPLKRRKVTQESSQETPGHDLSVYSWNVNGIEALLQPSISHFFSPKATSTSSGPNKNDSSHLSPLQVILARHHWPELYFLQEIKISPGDEASMRAVRKAVDGEDDRYSYSVHFCLPARGKATRRAGAKVYGVCTLLRRDFALKCVERTEEISWDSEGRFLVTYTLEMDDQPKLAIFNVYMVNGTSLLYRHQTSGAVLGTRHDRKLEVHALLQRECHRLHAEGYAVIIAGDINVARSELDGHPRLRTFPAQHIANRSDFQRRFLSTNTASRSVHDTAIDSEQPLGMVDTFRSLHPKRRGYSYYSRNVPFGESCDRVDMIIVSRSLEACCTAAAMHETEEDRGPSDHVPIFASFDFAREKS